MGVTRLVIKLNKVVIKIPNFTYSWAHFVKGILDNINEYKTYKYSSYTDTQHLLCPSLFNLGGFLQIMSRAELITPQTYETLDIEEHLKNYPGDDNHTNYGIYKGKVVKIDYAN